MVVGTDARRLLGRQREQAVLERLLQTARSGHGAVLVLHGEPGVGKTALLEYAVDAADDVRVVRTSGVEGEMELDYAAVQQLCSPILELVERLPEPQQDALGVAFGLTVGRAPNPFLVGLAVLGLLSEAAEAQPLLCLVDDAQWLDDASSRALEFVARRLLAERIALVFATRDGSGTLARLPQLGVNRLGRRDARTLLESALAARLDESVLDRIVAETGGNPLALLELPRGLTPAQLAGGFGLPAALPLSTGIEQSFTRRLQQLPQDARQLLLLAAAEPLGEAALLWRAASLLGIGETAVQPVESEGLVTLDGAVTFRHPLVRSAVYRAAEPSERRAVHRALAEATDPELDPDRRAWHRAQAAAVRDEEVAVELERSAARAEARGGLAAAAAFLQRAALLTPDPLSRARRSLVAAQTTFRAGSLADALSLLASTDAAPLDALGRARVELLRAQVAFASNHGRDAPTMLLEAAARLAPLSPELACETYLEALSAAMFAGRLALPGGRAADVSRAAMAAPRPPARRGHELLLDGFATLYSAGYRAAVPPLRRAHEAFDVSGLPANEQLRWKWLASVSSVLLWEDDRWEAIAERHVQLAREAGALADLPLALNMRVFAHLHAGELTTAASLVEEIRTASEAAGSNLAPYGGVGLAALRGRETEAVALIDGSTAAVIRRGEGVALLIFDWAQAVLYNGLGRYAEACTAALRIAEHPDDIGSSNWWMAELVEAAVRAGTPELAAGVRSRLSAMATASATDWAIGIAARCEALTAGDERAEELYVEAIARLGRTRMAVDHARAQLVYGEWLRRRRRRVDARAQLRLAHERFSASGMEAFAERARSELEAAGERARARAFDTLGELTAQEQQIARLAAQGRTNREIGAQLFISASTVEYHLHKAFRKLEVRSRTELARRLASASDD